MVKTIYLIDADKYFANAFINKLSQRGNYNVFHFMSYEEAHQQLSDASLDLILIEQKLRGKSGLESIKLIKRINPDVDIVMVSDQNDINVVEEAFECGAIKYFRKDILLIDHVEGFIKERVHADGRSWKRLFAN